MTIHRVFLLILTASLTAAIHIDTGFGQELLKMKRAVVAGSRTTTDFVSRSHMLVQLAICIH